MAKRKIIPLWLEGDAATTDGTTTVPIITLDMAVSAAQPDGLSNGDCLLFLEATFLAIMDGDPTLSFVAKRAGVLSYKAGTLALSTALGGSSAPLRTSTLGVFDWGSGNDANHCRFDVLTPKLQIGVIGIGGHSFTWMCDATIRLWQPT